MGFKAEHFLSDDPFNAFQVKTFNTAKFKRVGLCWDQCQLGKIFIGIHFYCITILVYVRTMRIFFINICIHNGPVLIALLRVVFVYFYWFCICKDNAQCPCIIL